MATDTDVVTPEQEQHSARAEVEYVVLMKKAASAVEWTGMSREPARSAEKAIEQWAESTEAPDGSVFVAVPARHWKPRRVKAETVTTLTIEDFA